MMFMQALSSEKPLDYHTSKGADDVFIAVVNRTIALLLIVILHDKIQLFILQITICNLSLGPNKCPVHKQYDD